MTLNTHTLQKHPYSQIRSYSESCPEVQLRCGNAQMGETVPATRAFQLCSCCDLCLRHPSSAHPYSKAQCLHSEAPSFRRSFVVPPGRITLSPLFPWGHVPRATHSTHLLFSYLSLKDRFQSRVRVDAILNGKRLSIQTFL